MAKVKGISFPDNKMDLVDYVESKNNFSQYIVDLIEKDITNNTSSLNKDKVMAIISNIQTQLLEIKKYL